MPRSPSSPRWRPAPAALAALALLLPACGGRGGLPPAPPPVVKGVDGKRYHVLDKGPYRAVYDAWGRLQRIEYDSNGDQRPDHVAHHRDGARVPHLIEVDVDFDGSPDRWEEYDPDGKLVRVGVSRRVAGRPDLWTVPGPDSLPARKEYDDDGDGRVERAEVLNAGRIVRVEIDGARKGRFDRWQEWREGRLVAEEIDTDGDGRADRRLRYSPTGTVAGVDPVR